MKTVDFLHQEPHQLQMTSYQVGKWHISLTVTKSAIKWYQNVDRGEKGQCTNP